MDLGVDPDMVYDLLLAVTEAVTNIIEHGYGDQPGWIKIRIDQDGRDIHIVLADQAPAFDPTQVPVPDLSIPLDQRVLGGMGIHLIRQHVDQLRYRAAAEGGNELVMICENIIPK